MTDGPSLHWIESGEGEPPLVLLHGFCADSHYWQPIQEGLVKEKRTIAFDLPGHGLSTSIDWGRGTGETAELMLATLKEMGVDSFHLAGHSLGGATACVMALKRPKSVLSMTLLAPGGFGSEINARLLRRMADGVTAAEIEIMLEQFYGSDARFPEALPTHMAESRRFSPNALPAIADSFLEGEEQGTLPIETIAELGMPVSVIWGTQDRVTPTRQAHKLPGVIGVHIFDRVGHSIVDEIPDQVLRILRENVL